MDFFENQNSEAHLSAENNPKNFPLPIWGMNADLQFLGNYFDLELAI